MDDTRLNQARALFSDGRKLLAQIANEGPQIQAHALLTRGQKCATSVISYIERLQQLEDGNGAA